MNAIRFPWLHCVPVKPPVQLAPLMMSLPAFGPPRASQRHQLTNDEQSAWTGSFKIGLATNSGMAAQLASAELHGLGVHHLDIFPGLVTAVTKSEVNEAIRRYLHPERATTVIAGTLD